MNDWISALNQQHVEQPAVKQPTTRAEWNALLDSLGAAVYEAATKITSDLDPAAIKAWKDAKAAYRDAETKAISKGWRAACHRCGGGGIYHTYGLCFHCGGRGIESAANSKQKFPNTLARIEQENAEAAAAASAAAALPDDVTAALQANRDSDRPNEFLGDLHATVYGRGLMLSEKQIEAVRRIAARAAEWEASKAAEAIALAAVPGLTEGRQRIVGEVVTVKWSNGQYPALKMLVRLADGNKVYGTVPAALDPYPDADEQTLVGATVEFTGTIEPSADDPHFGFFSRPAKASVLAEVAA